MRCSQSTTGYQKGLDVLLCGDYEADAAILPLSKSLQPGISKKLHIYFISKP